MARPMINPMMSMLMTVIDGARPKRILMLMPILISWPSWAVDVMLRKLMVSVLIPLLVLLPLSLRGNSGDIISMS